MTFIFLKRVYSLCTSNSFMDRQETQNNVSDENWHGYRLGDS